MDNLTGHSDFQESSFWKEKKATKNCHPKKKNYWYLLEITNLIIRYSAGANQTLKAPIFFTVVFKKYVIFDFGNSELTFKRKGSQWNFIKIIN